MKVKVDHVPSDPIQYMRTHQQGSATGRAPAVGALTVTNKFPTKTKTTTMSTGSNTTMTETSNAVITVQVSLLCAEERPKRRFSAGTASTDSTCGTSISSVRLVSFDESPTVHSYENDYDECATSYWYGKAEIKAMVEAEKVLVQRHIQAEPSYVTFLLQIWATPCTQEDVLARLVAPIHDSNMRGLEKHCLKSMKQRRSLVLKKVLQAQIDLYRYSYQYEYPPDPQERAHLLRLECEPLSRTSARFARAMALGDAMHQHTLP
jgi:hypothetical protein